MRLLQTLSSPQERLVGERVVVKEIEIFGNFWYPKIGEDIGGARQMAKQTMAKIKQRSDEAWSIQTEVTDGCQILRQLLVHRPQHLPAWLPFDFRWTHF